MTNSKMTRRALLTSVMALVLCFAMLTGTTFAWFTDQETSGNNQIIAGNLDIAMYNSIADYTDATRITTNSQFKLFDDVALWEPGAVAYENISVVNEGNLALKYQIFLNFEDKGLASALQVAVVEGGIDAATYPETSAGRTALIAAIDANTTNTWAPLASFSKTGNLYVDDGVGEKEVTATTYGIAVYWKPADNDNDYNVTGTQPSVDFGIKLIATQLAAELDAFGPEYDEPANWGDPWDGTADESALTYDAATDTYTVKDGEGLAALANKINGTTQMVNLSTDADTNVCDSNIVLEADIDLQNKPWTPIGPNADAANKFYGTFDGAGYTIYNLYVKQDADYKAAGLFGALNGTIKNLTVKNATIEALSAVGASGLTDNGIAVIAGSIYTKGTIDNVHVENATVTGNRYVGGISGYTYGNVTNCSVKNITLTATPDNLTGSYDNGDKVGGIAGYFASESVYKISGNTVENVTLKGYRDIGGIAGYANNSVTNNSVDGLTIYIDNSQNYKNYTTLDQYDAEAIVGEGAVDDTNKAENVTIVHEASVSTAEELQSVLDNATSGVKVVFANDITGDVEVTQKAGVDVVIDGNGNKFTGVMTTFGNGRQSGTETLVIKNIDFVAVNGAASCIVSPDRTVNNLYSYSHNVTVEKCTFTDPDGVVNCAAIRQEDGGDKNWTVIDCTVDNTMHSILQVNNVEGKLTVDGCTVESKNGANLNSCTNVEVVNCNFDVTGYAIRFGVNSGGNLGVAKNYVVKDSTLKSACDDGDAVIMFRASAVDAVLTLTNTTLTGTTEISGNTDATTINR